MSERAKLTTKISEAKRENSVTKTQRTDFSQSISSPVDHILFLHRTIGNQAVQRLLKAGVIQAKLKIGQPNDVYEQEADRVAEQVMRMPEDIAVSSRRSAVGGQKNDESVQRKPACPFAKGPSCGEEEVIQAKPLPNQITQLVQRRVEEEEEEPIQAKLVSQEHLTVQRQELPEGLEEDGRVLLKELSLKKPRVSDDIGERLSRTKFGGSSLPDKVRSSMESRFGVDFSQVRIHTDSNTVQMAQELNAAAFTNGRDIFFNSGRYDPHSQSGKRLLAHELTHVIQQSATKSILRKPFPQQLRISRIILHHTDLIPLQRQVEVHVNLRQPQRVKLFRRGEDNIVFSPVSAGRATESLIRPEPYSITKRTDPTARIGRWGLQYFAIFHDGIGFHSNIAYPLRRTLCADRRRYCTPRSDLDRRIEWRLTVDGTPRSHGCVRMRHSNAISLFNAVSDGTPVRVYKRRNWRNPS